MDHDNDPTPRLLASMAAGLVVVHAIHHPLVAVVAIALALAAIWGWP